uniref:Uncharacterized protein n=1 Tax=Aegilops tauschii subsp. strangulata TaxID=200361 RepID=A0A453G8F2_AEGTS
NPIPPAPPPARRPGRAPRSPPLGPLSLPTPPRRRWRARPGEARSAQAAAGLPSSPRAGGQARARSAGLGRRTGWRVRRHGVLRSGRRRAPGGGAAGVMVVVLASWHAGLTPGRRRGHGSCERGLGLPCSAGGSRWGGGGLLPAEIWLAGSSRSRQGWWRPVHERWRSSIRSG